MIIGFVIGYMEFQDFLSNIIRQAIRSWMGSSIGKGFDGLTTVEEPLKEPSDMPIREL
jgi:hypothetical protein